MDGSQKITCLPDVLNGWLYLNKNSISYTIDYSNARSLNNGLCHRFAPQKSPFSNRRKKDLVRVKTYQLSQGSNFAFPKT